MKLVIDTRLVDAVLDSEYEKVYSDPMFLKLKEHAEDFQQCKLSGEEYLDQLLHLDGIDILKDKETILRNCKILRSIDCQKIVDALERYLPHEAIENVGQITVFPVIGIAGLAMEDFIVIDPAPYPWYPSTGLDSEEYICKFLEPTLRHELHHVGCFALHGKTEIGDLKNTVMLAADYIHEMQLEGGAILCEKQDECKPLNEEENDMLNKALSRYMPVVRDWIVRNDEVNDADMNEYFQLWGESKHVYWLGELLCRKMISLGIYSCVAECMSDEPMKWIGNIYSFE